ncbi:OmpA family protein [Salinivibrio socompensis]|uniref:OmpA family protein n=1 Tax=Salinivibrio socompensis TaxID=1510206 RepID=UPI0004709AEA|nr:OmpA family protein [Salinivibrio socompensis]
MIKWINIALVLSLPNIVWANDALFDTDCVMQEGAAHYQVTTGESVIARTYQDNRLLAVAPQTIANNQWLVAQIDALDVSPQCTSFIKSHAYWQHAPNSPVARVHFDFDTSRLSPQGQAILQRFANSLAKYPSEVSVTGHTDNVGSVQYNQQLSQRRVDAVAPFIPSADGNTVTVSGQGETRPAATNHTEQGHAINRRVDIRISQ